MLRPRRLRLLALRLVLIILRASLLLPLAILLVAIPRLLPGTTMTATTEPGRGLLLLPRGTPLTRRLRL